MPDAATSMEIDAFLALPREEARKALGGMDPRRAKRLWAAYVRRHGRARPGARPASSGMRNFGRLLFLVGLAFSGLSVVAIVGDPTGESSVMWFATAAVWGIGAVMWMLGALEQRLIEIRDRLPAPSDQTAKDRSAAARRPLNLGAPACSGVNCANGAGR